MVTKLDTKFLNKTSSWPREWSVSASWGLIKAPQHLFKASHQTPSTSWPSLWCRGVEGVPHYAERRYFLSDSRWVKKSQFFIFRLEFFSSTVFARLTPLHTEKYFRNFDKSTRNQIVFTISDWFGSKRTSVWM